MLLNACVEHIRQYGGRMGVFHMDYEVQYSLTTEYVDEMLSSNRDILDVYRCCVPFKVGSAASMYQRFWRPWDPCVRWVREMPVEYLGTEAFDFYTPQMWDYEFRNVFPFGSASNLECKKWHVWLEYVPRKALTVGERSIVALRALQPTGYVLSMRA